MPSHTGATEFIIASRERSSGAKGKSTPTPRSKPSMSTYITTPKAMMTAQIIVISIVPMTAYLPARAVSSSNGVCAADSGRIGRSDSFSDSSEMPWCTTRVR
ncbi:hypothetical protein KBTX_02507 [wastewater metagenome]|uniref:Uncharacterized protein n=2 Tax=unclassified sequences TaxID=12908 RepID=A0A5B8RHJ0_9ZZZZ|nr:hypothetical protein KBTEX_02507 [uncultured organism]